jgi:hypothetical protein
MLSAYPNNPLHGKCPGGSTVFALTHEHLPRVLSTGTHFPGQTAPHLASSIDRLYIGHL